MSLTKDLTRLKELDPVIYYNYESWQLTLTEELNLSLYDDRIVNEMVLQHCLQDAIAARGWPVIISFDCNPDNPLIWEVEICSGEVNDLLGSAKADTPASALLSAYVAALEALP